MIDGLDAGGGVMAAADKELRPFGVFSALGAVAAGVLCLVAANGLDD